MEDKIVYQQWFSRKNLAEGTQTIYKVIAEDYKDYTGKNLSELIDEAENDEEQGIRLRKRKITSQMIGYKIKLEEKEFAPSTIKTYISAIISFYQAFDIQVPEITLPEGDIGLEENFSKLLTREEIQDMINVANARDRALIYLLALSGMSGAEARNLTIRKFLNTCSEAIGKEILDVEKLFEYEDLILKEIVTLNITRGKVNYRYQTFIPPEASRAIIAYLKERKFNRNPKRHIEDINGKLFITNDGNPMSKTGVGTAIKRVGTLAGFKSPEGAYCYWRPHALRKYFISTIINSIGDHILADYLAGHKISKIKRTYWLMDPESLKKRYMEALPYLSIDKIKVKDYESQEYRKIKRQLNTVKGIIDELGPLSKVIEIPKVKQVIDEELRRINL